MCETCGCGDPNLVPVDVHYSILSKNDVQARHNRHYSKKYPIEEGSERDYGDALTTGDPFSRKDQDSK